MDRGTIWRVGVPLVMGVLALTMIFLKWPGERGTVRWVGLGLAAIGLSGVLLARYTLGQSFSVAPKARVLVTRGIYSKIRNPIYVSGVIFLAGVGLIMWHPYFFALLAVVIPMQILRARKEAQVLEEKFGEEYRAYRRQTWF
jgi:protein-S-isoprenylcysteine O-methyltransferase Ste14